MKKRGFTLIELLGVIVILAIILVISVPIVLNLIDSSRKQAFFSNVKTIVNTARLQAETEYSGQYPIYTFTNNKQNDGKYGSLNLKGDVPYEGFIYFTNGIIEGVENSSEDLFPVFYLVSSDRKYVAYNNAGTEFTLNNIVANSGITYNASTKTYTINQSTKVVNEYTERIATFDSGVTVMNKMKKLAGNTANGMWDADSNITEIKYSKNGVPSQWTSQTGKIAPPSNENIVSSSSSNIKIYMWYDNGIIYWWSEDPRPQLNKNSSFMFCNLTKLVNIPELRKFDASNLERITSMFYGCNSLTSLELGNFNTSKVTEMSGLFSGCTSLSNLDLSNFDTSNVEDMNSMFKGIAVNSLDLTNFNTAKVKNMSYMFWDAKIQSLDLSGFNISSVENFNYMFWDATNLKTVYVSNSFVIPSNASSTNMFYNTNKIAGGKGTTLNWSHLDASYAHIDGGTSNPGYFTEIVE